MQPASYVLLHGIIITFTLCATFSEGASRSIGPKRGVESPCHRMKISFLVSCLSNHHFLVLSMPVISVLSLQSRSSRKYNAMAYASVLDASYRCCVINLARSISSHVRTYALCAREYGRPLWRYGYIIIYAYTYIYGRVRGKFELHILCTSCELLGDADIELKLE